MDMDTKSTSFGSSLKVPIVQELAEQKISTVPSRYIRHDIDDLVPSNLSSSSQIPVIDMCNMFDPHLMEFEIRKLHHACKEWGFFQLINHGVEIEVVEKMKQELREFFNLPLEEKRKLMRKEEELEGYGQLFVVSEDQKLDWGDLFHLTTFPNHLRNPHLISNLPPTFREAMEVYGSQLLKLGIEILKQMMKALDVNPEDMEPVIGEGRQTMRMNYYPPCPQPQLVNGLSPHSDASAITILLQVGETDGLQVKNNGKWVPVSPLPHAFVVNVGEVVEIMSNGTYRSIEHQATVNSREARLSIATFLLPKLDGEIGPAPSLVSPERPANFKKISVTDYYHRFFSKELKGKSNVDSMKI